MKKVILPLLLCLSCTFMISCHPNDPTPEPQPQPEEKYYYARYEIDTEDSIPMKLEIVYAGEEYGQTDNRLKYIYTPWRSNVRLNTNTADFTAMCANESDIGRTRLIGKIIVNDTIVAQDTSGILVPLITVAYTFK